MNNPPTAARWRSIKRDGRSITAVLVPAKEKFKKVDQRAGFTATQGSLCKWSNAKWNSAARKKKKKKKIKAVLKICNSVFKGHSYCGQRFQEQSICVFVCANFRSTWEGPLLYWLLQFKCPQSNCAQCSKNSPADLPLIYEAVLSLDDYLSDVKKKSELRICSDCVNREVIDQLNQW